MFLLPYSLVLLKQEYEKIYEVYAIIPLPYSLVLLKQSYALQI